MGAQRPGLCVNKLKKTGARSARARMRGQNPLVKNVCIKNVTVPLNDGINHVLQNRCLVCMVLY
jgi:hypothetical protein